MSYLYSKLPETVVSPLIGTGGTDYSFDDLDVVRFDWLAAGDRFAPALGLFFGHAPVSLNLLSGVWTQMVEHVERNTGLDQHGTSIFVARELATDHALGVNQCARKVCGSARRCDRRR
jgi:hypothetical protein